jgi:ABC-type uncharacterized transport system substrate-binding protein
LVGLHPDIIVTMGATATVAVQRETRTIPIVFGTTGEPVASGIVLNPPYRNITGFYGPDPVDISRRAASYVDRILRGAWPAELPVQAADKILR